jgi:hypothetical protein
MLLNDACQTAGLGVSPKLVDKSGLVWFSEQGPVVQKLVNFNPWLALTLS